MATPTIWGIHMGRHHRTRPVDEGYVAIGWRELGDLSRLPKDREALKRRLLEAYPDTKPGAVPGELSR